MDSESNNRVAVVIPIYKSCLTRNEEISLSQGIKIFESYPIIFFCPQSLIVPDYLREIIIKDNVSIERFHNAFFENIAGYNKLMLSVDFYNRFLRFEYILIYQLDGFVFRDELIEWCNKGFDYIGAPWFEGFSSTSHGNELMYVGNGGVSLRRINTCLRLLKSKRIYYSFSEVYKKYSNRWDDKYGIAINIIRILFVSLGYKNNARYFIKTHRDNEDHIWGIHSSKLLPKFKVASVDEAISFSFECDPRHLYKLNGNKLPFCCHAWEKWDLDFWKPFIKEEGFTL
jgi:hypothetical protein